MSRTNIKLIYGCGLVDGVPFCRKLAWGDVAMSGVASASDVAESPDLEEYPGSEEAGKLPAFEELVTETVLERLDPLVPLSVFGIDKNCSDVFKPASVVVLIHVIGFSPSRSQSP